LFSLSGINRALAATLAGWPAVYMGAVVTA